ncbi:HGL197Cp [Eremothecium sinecaudum]|uniref:HGL197Cp n=1 Tax=Eremothecium sinecaudum TaxID=45286 RepID=A0A109V0M8_9SACH|nr:HGL197Cp [Eremothecium sinecaudum]AMD22143.1 HGL197Cp [Eremothecium sinecaudum]
MSEWWLNALFDTYDKGKQKVEDFGVTATQAITHVYGITKDAWSEIIEKQRFNEYLDSFELNKLGSEIPRSSKVAFSENGNEGKIFSVLVGILSNRALKIGAGITAAGILLYGVGKFAIPTLPAHLETDKEVLLIIGDMSDPITRSLVYDLYRRGFILFICSTKEGNDTQLEEEYEQIPSPWDKEDGLIHITSLKASLTRFSKYLEQENKHLRGIVVIPNVSYYTSGIFTNISSDQLRTELAVNFVNIWGILSRLIPQFNTAYKDKLQVIVCNPSLSKNLNVPYHSLEGLVSSLMDSLYQIMKNECSYLADVYQCHLGILNVAANASNYKYLTISGSHTMNSLCTPIYELLLSNDYIWFRFKRWLQGSTLYCGKGSIITNWLKTWTPVWILELI